MPDVPVRRSTLQHNAGTTKKKSIVSPDGVSAVPALTTRKKGWKFEFEPAFTPEQWAAFRERQSEVHDPETGGLSKERSKDLILSIAPSTVFFEK